MRRLFSILFVGGLLVAARADEETATPRTATPRTAAEVANRAVAAFDIDDDAALRQVARARGPDPWLVVDEIHHVGRLDVARVYAAAGPTETAPALSAYVEGRKNRPPDDVARVAAAQAYAALRAGRWQDALDATTEIGPPYETAVRIRALGGRAHALRRLGRVEESIEEFERAATAAEGIGWLRPAGHFFRQSAKSASQAGDWSRNLEQNQRAREAYATLGDAVEVGRAILHIGRACEKLGRLEEALVYCQEALAHAESTRYAPGVADALYSIGKVHGRSGRLDQARVAMARGLAIAEEIEHHALTGRGLTNLGATLVELGRYREALDAFRRALPVSRALGNGQGLAATYNDIGATYVHLGEYPEALEAFHQALSAAEEANDGAGVAATLENLGVLHARLGRDEEALRHYDRALSAARRAGLKAFTAGLLMNIANAHEREGRLEEAEPLYRQSLVLSEALGDPRKIATSLVNLAALLARRGNAEGATAAAQRALEIAKEQTDARVQALVLGKIGEIHERSGQEEEALAAYADAIRHLQEIPVPHARARALGGQARILLKRGEAKRAVAVAQDAVREVSGLAEGLADAEAAGAKEIFSGLFRVGLEAALQSNDVDAAAFFFEYGRAGALREGLGARGALATAIVPPDLREELALARAAQTAALAAYRAAQARGDRRAQRAARRAQEEAATALEAAVARLQREAKRAASIVCPNPDDLEAIRRHLQASEALVYYGTTDTVAAALVVRPEGARIVELGPSVAIENAVSAVLLDDEPHIEPAAVAPLEALLGRPLELPGDVQRILVCPAGRLGYLPFSLLFPARDVAYVPSGTAYGLLLGGGDAPGAGILALGDPAYGTVATPPAAAHRGWNADRLVRLPETRAEASSVGTVTLLGDEATETRLTSALAERVRWRAVHFACHGLIDPEHPVLSSLALTPEERTDGFLTCLEIFRMQIPADLVVLSACETARGRIYETEGILGLTRAFMFAGSPRVLCSLWPVDDEATRALMVEFYALWNPEEGEGLSPAAALRRAQEKVRTHAKWSHPYYWAAWVLWGPPD